jgi:superfamily II DNA or RNA helicase
VLGLEVARRIGRRTLVLTPNTAVQSQWVAQWQRLFTGTGVSVTTERDEPADLVVLTYQAMTSWDRPEGDGEAVREQRRLAVRGQGDLLALLHPRAQAFLAHASGSGPWTLVLDECHHLLDVWGALAGAVVDAFGTQTWVVGLTATPPVALTAPQRERHDALFGACDVVVDLPSVVKEGDLAPYQELVLYCAPTVEEDTWIAAERTRFSDLQLALVQARTGSLPLAEWLRRRLETRTADDGPPVSWPAFEAVDPELARAGLRLAHQGLVPLPAGARLREEHRVEPDAQDWAAVLGGYALEQLEPSPDPADQRLLADVKRVLPGLGWTLTRRGLRVTTSPVDRVCALSSSKTSAAVQILQAELDALGEDLRALVLCDYEDKAAQAPSELGQPPRSGSAVLALLAVAQSSLGPLLRPVLVTGRRVAAAPEVAADLAQWVQEQGGPRLSRVALPSEPLLHELVGGTGEWGPRTWTPLLTRYLVDGATACLIGTRGLLGEGWDCPALSVVVDLTSAATATAVTQMRGRAMRADPERPEKVADGWTVVCVADGHPRGDADHLRAARKHERHLAMAPSGEISSGLGHCDPVLAPFAPPSEQERLAVNARALGGPSRRDQVRAAWRVGEPYEGRETTTLRVRAERGLGLPGGVLAPGLLRGTALLGSQGRGPSVPSGRPTALWPLPLTAGAVTAAGGALVAGPVRAVAGVGVAAAVALAQGALRYSRQRELLDAPPATGAVEQLAAAVADALQAVGDTGKGADGLLLRPTVDGWLRCELHGVGEAQSAAFADALDELLAPLAEPRLLVARLVLPLPTTREAKRRLARSRALGRRVDAAVAWHAVPTALGRNKARAAALAAAWERHVGPTRVLSARSADGLAVLDLLRGADPYAVTSQIRTVWS